MIKYFRIEEITEDDFEELTGIKMKMECQVNVQCDNGVFTAVKADEGEMTVSLDMFD